jgi:hypothetical protein
MTAMTQLNIVASGPAVHLDPDDGEAFRLGPLEIIVKEDGSGTRMNLAVAEFRGEAFRIPPHLHTVRDETITTGLLPADVIAKVMGHYGLQPVNP